MIIHIAELQFWGNKQGISLYYQSQSYICIDFIYPLRGEVNILALPRLAGENITSYAFCLLPVTYSQI